MSLGGAAQPAAGRLAGRANLGRGFVELEIEAPSVARAAKPGQFVGILPPGSDGTILRRPFSIADVRGTRLLILCREVGKGTRALGSCAKGARLELLGPLGKGFVLPERGIDFAVLVGGGYGVAPLFFLARTIRKLKLARRITLLVGARTAADLVWRRKLKKERWLDTKWSTDDGSAGRSGTVVGLYVRTISELCGDVRSYACGPTAMMADLFRRGAGEPIQVAMEARMACGTGACQGCVVPSARGDGHGRYVRVCSDGPVFDIREIDWDACEED